MKAQLILLVGMGLLLSQACSSPTVCPLTARAGLRVEVVDSITLLPPRSPASLIISGTNADTLPRPGDTTFNGHSFTALYGAPGTYMLSVHASGYKPWLATNVIVPGNACGDVAQTIEMTAKLQAEI